MMTTYEFLCGHPDCQKPVVVRRSSKHPLPIYCSRRCAGRANAFRQIDRERVWRKYHFDDLMNTAITRAVRKGYGHLKPLWRDDPRFAQAGIPYPIVKRQAVLLGLVRTESGVAWQEDETAFAVERWQRGMSPERIAKKMRLQGWHRTASAIVTQMERVGEHRNENFLSLNQVAKAFGVDSHVPIRWARLGWLPIHHKSDMGEKHLVTYEAVRNFVIAHPCEVAKAHPDIVWLIGLLTDPSAGKANSATENDEDGSWMNGTTVLYKGVVE